MRMKISNIFQANEPWIEKKEKKKKCTKNKIVEIVE